MKTMTCKQLGGACDKKFQTESFEELGEMAKSHAMEMFATGDEAHLKAMEKMKDLMNDPAAMKEWIEKKRKEFEALPEDK